MSLSSDSMIERLRAGFACGYQDISAESYCGQSRAYAPDQGAVHTTNGAGPHNMQLFILAADGTVLTCLPGFWDPADLAYELAFAEELAAIWANPSLTDVEKRTRFVEKHLGHVAQHPKEMVKRSPMQGFDKKFELNRRETSDCVLGDNEVKTTDRILHERMAKQPFVAYDRFDVVAFSDYGRPYYDKKKAIEGDATKLETEFGVDLPLREEKKKDACGFDAAALEAFLRKAGVDGADLSDRVAAHVSGHADSGCHCTCLHELAHELVGARAKKKKK